MSEVYDNVRQCVEDVEGRTAELVNLFDDSEDPTDMYAMRDIYDNLKDEVASLGKALAEGIDLLELGSDDELDR